MTRKKALTICRSVRLKTIWAMDFDYLHKLSEEQIGFLADFCNFYYHGSPHKVESLQITQKLRKESYNRNNKAESDIYTKFKKEGEELADSMPDFYDEDYIIEFIDKKYI